jgi:hypothetical protein
MTESSADEEMTGDHVPPFNVMRNIFGRVSSYPSSVSNTHWDFDITCKHILDIENAHPAQPGSTISCTFRRLSVPSHVDSSHIPPIQTNHHVPDPFSHIATQSPEFFNSLLTGAVLRLSRTRYDSCTDFRLGMPIAAFDPILSRPGIVSTKSRRFSKSGG